MVAVMHHLMGAAEIQELLGVSRQRVQQLVKRADFPQPDADLAMGKVWRRTDVERWADSRSQRLVGESADGPPVPNDPLKRGNDLRQAIVDER